MISLLKSFIVAIVIFLLVGCTSDNKSTGIKKIGIIQFVEHEALNAARTGFVNELSMLGYKHGININIEYRNAQGDTATCNSIASKFVNDGCDLMLAIATPAAQAVANATQDVPILVTAITDPASAQLVKSNELPETNVTGTSDLAPVAKQIGLIKKLKPEAKKIGVFYCSNEANSIYQGNLAVEQAKNLGLDAQVFTVSQVSEIAQVVESMVQKVDAVYAPTDNMVAISMPQISELAMTYGVFVVSAWAEGVNKGAIGTYGMDYYELGKLTAQQAKEILDGTNTPNKMPIKYLEQSRLTLNSDVIDRLSINVPDDLKADASFVKTSN